MIKRLRNRFIRIAMLAVISVMIVLCLIVNIANYVSVNSQLNQMLQIICDNQGRLPAAPPDHVPEEKPGGQFTPETPYSTRYFVLRYTDDGVLTQADLKHIAAVTEADTDAYLALAVKHGEGFGYTSGYKFYVIHSGENRWMAIFLDSYQELRRVLMTAVLSLAAVTFCIVLVYLLVVLFSRKAIDPVVKSYERQKQFITDAGHELKTPITVIATSLKVLELEVGSQKWISKAQAQTEKLTELVNSLVTLSRMDEEDTPLKFRYFSISDSLREAVESFRDYAQSNGHALQISIAPEIDFCGDEYAVRQLVSILLDNAIKYAAPNTPIAFSLAKTRKGIVIHTANECDQLDAGDLNKLFERFYRADKARNAATGGFGIGLSIARSIAEGHKGIICASSTDGHCIEFKAELRDSQAAACR